MKIGRNGAEWDRIRKLVLTGTTICAMPHCKYPGSPLNWNDKVFSPNHPTGWRPGPTYPSVDHMIEVQVTEGWSDAEKRAALHDPRWLRAAHIGCNSSARARKYTPRRPSHSPPPTRDWGV
jgi:hypothetical protein